jgi:hypothetical protein
MGNKIDFLEMGDSYGTTMNEKMVRQNLRNFRAQMKHVLMTSRFNNETFEENAEFRETHANIGCIYCSPQTISREIMLDSVMFILEMNNDKNKIMGIGMVRNHPYSGKYNVYKNGNYNRYVYVGKHRIDRSDMTEEEDKIMQVFDILCFTGNRHMKRGQGLRAFPIETLFKCNKTLDLVGFIGNMFKSRM